MLLDDYYKENDINLIKSNESATTIKHQLIKESSDFQYHLDELNSYISDIDK